MPIARLFFMGLFISFLGTLPFGTLNVMAARLAAEAGIGPAVWFSIGALLVEMIYVRLSLVAMDWVRKKRSLFRGLEWVMIAVILILALASFRTALQPAGPYSMNIGLGFHYGPIWCLLLGIGLSAINPLQIPFWFGWSTVLAAKGVLRPSPGYYNGYIIGIGLGTFAGNAVFIFGGRLLIRSLQVNGHIVDWVTGGIFAITGLILLWKALFRKDPLNI
jgi:threonine/homoserine/homoserine lactone efflux protein